VPNDGRDIRLSYIRPVKELHSVEFDEKCASATVVLNIDNRSFAAVRQPYNVKFLEFQ